MLVYIEPFDSTREMFTCKYGVFLGKLADRSIGNPCHVEIDIMDKIDCSLIKLSEENKYSISYAQDTIEICGYMEEYEIEEDSTLAWLRFGDLLIPINVVNDNRFNNYVGKYVLVKVSNIIIYPLDLP